MDPSPYSHRWARRRRTRSRALLQIVGIGVVLTLVLLATAGVDLYTEWLWFESVGYTAVFATALGTQGALFLAGALAFAVLLFPNAAIARRLARRSHAHEHAAAEEDGIWAYVAQMGARIGQDDGAGRLITLGVLLAGLVLATIMGLVAAGQWDTLLRFRNAVPFERADPIFSLDVSFYVFQLPFYRALHTWLLVAAVFVAIATLAVYLLTVGYELGVPLERAVQRPGRAIYVHVAALVAALFGLMAVNHLLERFELVYSTRGAVQGASYTDVTVLAPALLVMAAAALVGGALTLLGGLRQGYRLALLGFALWGLVALFGGVLVPAVFERVVVAPNQLERERPFIEYAIGMTRAAFALDRVEERTYPAEETLTPEEVRDNQVTIQNVRLWDHRPLLEALNQLQTIRTYYRFNDVDVDRYTIDGTYRQVMVAARELALDALPGQSRTWINQHLQFTHGYGAVMSLVAAVAEEGRPVLLTRDVPPVGNPPITRPEIYYGEGTSTYVLVNTSEPEFDYERGDQSVTTQYQARSGVNLGSPLRRLAYALHFRDLNLLLTTQLRPESQLLYRRLVAERVQRIAPFLMLDRDPYLVVADGRLFWMVDAYTTSNEYPYSQSSFWRPRQRWINYVRNSVKAVVDAYDGSVRLYVSDPEDPIIRTYERIFPGAFRPLDELPASLRVHLRYPEDLFTLQAHVYQTYHVTDPTALYNRVDVWAVPFERFYEQRQPVDPYFVIMRLPEEEREEFLLMQPFTPTGRDNMIAWLAARSDEPNYGRLIVYRYPKDRFINGPSNVEARIDQDTAISAQFTLWGQAGSRVIRGNLLAIPIGRSNLYVEPIYLQAEDRPIPELKQVVVASGNRVVMDATLEAALARLFGTTAGTAPGAAPPPQAGAPQPGALPGAVADLVRSARQHYERAQEALRAGDWARYGEEQKALEADLKRLSELAGQ